MSFSIHFFFLRKIEWNNFLFFVSFQKFTDATQWVLHNNHSYDFGKAGLQVNVRDIFYENFDFHVWEDNKIIPLLLEEILKTNEQMWINAWASDEPGSGEEWHAF